MFFPQKNYMYDSKKSFLSCILFLLGKTNDFLKDMDRNVPEHSHNGGPEPAILFSTMQLHTC